MLARGHILLRTPADEGRARAVGQRVRDLDLFFFFRQSLLDTGRARTRTQPHATLYLKGQALVADLHARVIYNMCVPRWTPPSWPLPCAVVRAASLQIAIFALP